MPTMEAIAEKIGNGGDGSIPVDRLPVDEADRFQPTADGLGFFRFIAAKLTGQLVPQPVMSDHYYANGGRSRRDIAPVFEGNSYRG